MSRPRDRKPSKSRAREPITAVVNVRRVVDPAGHRRLVAALSRLLDDVEHGDPPKVIASDAPNVTAPGDEEPAPIVLAPIDEDVLDIDGAAELLHVGRDTVYAEVARNAIPHRRLGKLIRFSRVALLRWLDAPTHND